MITRRQPHKRDVTSVILWSLLVLTVIQLPACVTRPTDVAGLHQPSQQVESTHARQDVAPQQPPEELNLSRLRSPDVQQTEDSIGPGPEFRMNQTVPHGELEKTGQEDVENTWPYKLLAAPEYVWAGLAYPFKKLIIAYEKHDVMNRALDLFLNDARTRGVYPRFAIGGTLSSGIGLTAFDNNFLQRGKEARASYLFAARGNQVGEVFYRDASLFGSQWSFETSGFWLDFDEGHFYRNGNRAREEDRANFKLNQLTWDTTLERKLFGHWSAALTGRLIIADAKPSDHFLETPTFVTNSARSMTALAVEPSLRYDSRDNSFRPTVGWFAETAFTYTDQVDRNQFRYLGYRVEIQRYIPVFRGDRVLLLRAYVSKQDGVGGGAIPFYELNLLDLNNGLRGFDRGRWQDQGALLFNIEWRFPVWQDVEGSLFFDEGQVFHSYENISLKQFRYSAGGGLRFVSDDKFGFRIQAAVSEDGVLMLIRGNLEFTRRRAATLGF
ncbi:MAG TPA: BamA/TamA family outer membrane protein [Nitrospira sp.]|nr:BamA/TamA family outer membrane protein [Nitrospira sp.]